MVLRLTGGLSDGPQQLLMVPPGLRHPGEDAKQTRARNDAYACCGLREQENAAEPVQNRQDNQYLNHNSSQVLKW